MNPPWVYMCSPSWNPLPFPLRPIPLVSSQCTRPEPPVSCIEPGLAIHFTCDNLHVSMPFSQTIPPSPSPIESKRLFYTSVSLLLSRIQDYRYIFLNSIYICVAAAAAAAKWLQSCPTLCDPHRWQPTRLCHPWASPGKNTGVGCHFFLHIYALVHCTSVFLSGLLHSV